MRSISTKFVLFTTSLIVIAILSLSVITGFRFYDSSLKNIYIIAEETAYHYGASVESELERGLVTARTLASVFSSAVNNPEDVRFDREAAHTILRHFIEENPEFHSVYLVFESGVLDGLDTDSGFLPSSGTAERFAPCWLRTDTGTASVHTRLGYDRNGSPYHRSRETGAAYVSDPYVYSFGGKGTHVVSLVAPIFETNTGSFLGIAGIDVAITGFQEYVKNVDVGAFDSAAVTVFSQNGMITASADEAKVGTYVTMTEEGKRISENILGQKSFSTTIIDTESGRRNLFCGIPITVGSDRQRWMVGISIAWEEILAEMNRLFVTISLIGIAVIAVSITVVLVITRVLIKPVKDVGRMLKEISEGDSDLTKEIDITTRDEAGMLAGSYNSFIERLRLIISGLKQSAAQTMEVKNHLVVKTEEASVTVNLIDSNAARINGRIGELDDQINSSAGALERITATLQELNGQIVHQAGAVSESAGSVEEMIASQKNVLMITEAEKESTRILVEKANEGGDKLGHSVEIIGEITQKVGDILEMISIIQEISSRTDLLAMNAAIEAAHAGDAGKGFAVVAEEIGRLSEATAENSATISTVLKTVVEKIERAGTAGDDTLRVFREINEKVAQVALGLEEINRSTLEIAGGGEQILKAMTSLNEITVRVREKSESIERNAETTIDSMRLVRTISADVRSDIHVIADGTKEIRMAFDSVSGYAAQLDESSERLQSEVNNLKT